MIAVYCENYMKYTNTFYEQNAELIIEYVVHIITTTL
jgi:hypothetical protein